ncbi:cysteine hydrolase family protein [Brevifollis gellanilyticus]|uniref:Putative isochorismatase family protein YaaI n=1 Tax=Brevifollis gellanilyticus TaxID=748831 RepID=A0A512M2G5_9BACT|nr:isochorismatase family cysteine hydrolase [Brevifollis gellanilyticus]GEP40926.1 putative isochorismatase family protein YaaI [Brevifollis gellanilyticus]
MASKRHRAGNVAPDRSGCVLLLIDVINDFEFPEARQLLRYALPAAKRIAALKRRLGASGIPSIYVNDNFGRWRSDFKHQVEHCLRGECLGAPIAKMLMPTENDYFVLKPKHSGFYCTSLDPLLSSLGAERLILVGFAADICVLFTANDAYMRDYQLIVPADCVAAETSAAHRYACQQMQRFLRADTRQSRALTPKRLRTG